MTITAPNPERAPIRVGAEPLTYTERGSHSYFMDLARASRGDWQAKDRLARHRKETEARQVKADTSRAEAEGFEFRVAPNSTDGTGGEFAPPAWLVDKFATAPRTSRVTPDLIGSNVLPAGVNQINIPRITTGASTSTQIDSGGASSTDIVSAASTSPVVTIAGDIDISQQLLDLTPGGFDVVAYRELLASYDEKLAQQVVAGSGSGGQLTGLTNVASINTVAGAGITTLAAFWPLLGQAAAAIGNNRKQPMQNWVMAPRRFAWMLSLLDTGNAPLNPMGDGTDVYGCPIAQAGSLLTAIASADSIIGFRPEDCYLWESDPHLSVTPSPMSGTLQVRIQLRRYVAAVLSLYPSSIAVITNLPAPANF